MSKTLLYLHGFRSVGMCDKGREIVSFAPDALTPNLPYVPNLAIALAESLIAQYKAENLCLIGSSLGGYYATFLAHKYKIKSLLINPVINAYETLLPAIGKVFVPYSGESFFWSLDLVESLRQYFVESLDYSLYCVLLQEGDAILDYRVAKRRFCDSKLVISAGGSHRFENLSAQKDVILEWAQVS